MATIKLQPSGAVVLKDGKVACSCCAGPSECCMYPAEALADGLYSADDLPDTIILELTNQLQPGPEYCPREVLSRSDDGYLYGYGDPLDTTPGNKAARISLYFSEEQQGWFFSFLQVEYKDPGAGAENRVYIGGWEDTCLLENIFDNLIIEDQFADSYTITPNVGDSAFPTVVTRISLCVWRGTDTCGNFVYLSYGTNPDGGQDIMWNVFFRFYTPTCVIDGQVDGQKNEGEFENTPVGTYSGTFEDSASVS